jgi:hypothetical protein
MDRRDSLKKPPLSSAARPPYTTHVLNDADLADICAFVASRPTPEG